MTALGERALGERGDSEGRPLRVLSIANQKGGVGKTTTAINLGTALAAIGERVLILDLDPQGNASTGLGVAAHSRDRTTYNLLTETYTLKESQRATHVPRLSLVPASLDLLGFEVEYSQDSGRNFKLKEAIAAYKNACNDEGCVSYILIDCPPSLNLLTLNAFVASNAIIVPLQCEFFALEGLSQLLSTIDKVKHSMNRSLMIHGVVLTMFDPRNSLSAQVAADVRGFLGDKVYETVIPRNVRVSEAPSHGKPVLLYDLKCAGSQAYLKLASEIIRRERCSLAA